MSLSKSDYMLYLKHPAWLWFKKHDKHRLPKVSESTQALFDAGNVFERYAEELFPKGMHLGFSGFDEYQSLVDRTARALRDGEKTIYQGRFEADGLTFICDVLQVIDDKLVDLTEIKATTSVKPEHIKDLAFQMVVLEKCGYEVRTIYVAHVDNSYVRDGDIEPEKLTRTTNVTKKVKALRDETLANIEVAKQTAISDQCPDTSPALAKMGTFKEWLGIYLSHNEQKDGSIFELGGLNAVQLAQFESEGISQLVDIPLDFTLKPKQALQLEAYRSQKPMIQREHIQQFLGSFEYPLYFLDYETMSSVVPYFDKQAPYKQYPFQYSLHVIESPGAEVQHYEYLHTNNSDPIQLLSESLRSHIGVNGSVITWNMSFEKNCNTLMGELLLEYADFYEQLNERVVDLMLPFAKGCYVDHRFKTSASIKAVLPVLVPKLNHSDLDISDGQTAQRLWMATILDGENTEERDDIIQNLIDYCKLDTRAMVEIWRRLRAL